MVRENSIRPIFWVSVRLLCLFSAIGKKDASDEKAKRKGKKAGLPGLPTKGPLKTAK